MTNERENLSVESLEIDPNRLIGRRKAKKKIGNYLRIISINSALPF